MYGQSCRVVGRGGVGPLRFGGASLCWGRSVTLQSHWSMGIPQDRWVHLARQYIALPRPWLPLQMESSMSKDLRCHVLQMWGSSDSSPRAYVSRRGFCGGGRSRRGGGSRCRAPPSGQLVRGRGWWRRCSADCTSESCTWRGLAAGRRGWGCPSGRGAGSCSGGPSGLPMFPAPILWCRFGWRWVGGWAMLGSR